MRWMLILFVLFICLVSFFYFNQRKFIYFPLKVKPEIPHSLPKMSTILLKTKDGLSIYGWYQPATENKPTLLVFHGNAGNIGMRVPLASYFIQKGYGVFLLEYRGYGGNPGYPTEKGLLDDGQTALDFLHTKGASVVLYGESLGTGIAIQLATQNKVCAVILQSPYTSFRALMRIHYPWLFISPWDNYDSLSYIQKVKAPILILHGTSDFIVPYNQGVTLFKTAQSPKSLITLEGYGHNNLWKDSFFNTVDEFLQNQCNSEKT
jgi:fermentation-respiration switch protein FrsA (DUF1100 family)